MKVPLAEIIAIVTPDQARLGNRPPSGIRSAVRSSEGASAGHTGKAARAGGVTLHAAQDREFGESAEAEEINVIGCTVEEATRRVDKFLDNAALAGKPQIRIIHGHGTGALRRGLADFFSTHPLVERIHAEVDYRGGAAVTVVELKD
jgi:DNA mismatch repair protein MutS2